MLLYINFPRDFSFQEDLLSEVVETPVVVDAVVHVGQLLAIFKIQDQIFELHAPYAGRIRTILVKPKDQVADKQPIFDMQILEAVAIKTQEANHHLDLSKTFVQQHSTTSTLQKELTSNQIDGRVFVPLVKSEVARNLLLETLWAEMKSKDLETVVSVVVSPSEQLLSREKSKPSFMNEESGRHMQKQVRAFVTQMFSSQNIKAMLNEKEQIFLNQMLGHNPQAVITRMQNIFLQLAQENGFQFISHSTQKTYNNRVAGSFSQQSSQSFGNDVSFSRLSTQGRQASILAKLLEGAGHVKDKDEGLVEAKRFAAFLSNVLKTAGTFFQLVREQMQPISSSKRTGHSRE
jgi:hypothetical protein